MSHSPLTDLNAPPGNVRYGLTSREDAPTEKGSVLVTGTARILSPVMFLLH